MYGGAGPYLVLIEPKLSTLGIISELNAPDRINKGERGNTSI